METAIEQKSLEEQIIHYTELTNKFKNESGKIRQYTEAFNKIAELKAEIIVRDGQLEFKKKQEQRIKEADLAQRQRANTPPQVEGKLIPIVQTANRRFLVKWDEKRGVPISYWIRILKPHKTTLTHDVFPGTQFDAFQRALQVWLQGQG